VSRRGGTADRAEMQEKNPELLKQMETKTMRWQLLYAIGKGAAVEVRGKRGDLKHNRRMEQKDAVKWDEKTKNLSSSTVKEDQTE
jgi:hypothetical protein